MPLREVDMLRINSLYFMKSMIPSNAVCGPIHILSMILFVLYSRHPSFSCFTNLQSLTYVYVPDIRYRIVIPTPRVDTDSRGEAATCLRSWTDIIAPATYDRLYLYHPTPACVIPFRFNKLTISI